MPNEIITYIEMCQREGTSLQRGMNFKLGRDHSVILMSVRPNAPYEDRFEDDGMTIIYEGHDAPKSVSLPNPKQTDQPEYNPTGKPTQNGLFYKAALAFKLNGFSPERVRVYEKIKQGIWSYNGLFHLTDTWKESIDNRIVFKFKLSAIDNEEESTTLRPLKTQPRRIIPTKIKIEVWKRDSGKCTICGATDDLHFDHIIPWSKGGSSNTSENIQILCGKHNLKKHDRIE